MARVIAIGQPVNDSEREAIVYLRDHLPNGCVVIHNFELRQGQELYEIDIALLTRHSVFVVDVKGTRGPIDVYGARWYPEGRAPYHSPLAILRKHAKALKTFICDQRPAETALRGLYVDAAVLMTSPDAHVQDGGGQDGPSVAYLKKCVAFFQDKARVPPGFSTDIRAQLTLVEKAIVGRAQPKSAPPCYGNWQVEEKLGGTDRYSEYRAKHTLLGARRGGTARLRVYHVDAYLTAEERERQVKLISNAFRSLAGLPGHPNILSVREFFDDEDARNWFALVTEDVAGQALRQHIKKSGLALTYDQKIGTIRDVLAALDHAHRNDPQVIHRNLTPDAVLVSSAGRALLCGFDYARAGKDRTSTIAEEIVDELESLYQAPECYRDPSKASVASDLFSAGLVFYELLVGESPWSSIDDMMEKDGVFPVKPSELKPELPVGLNDWLQTLCAFDAEDRPNSAALALARFNDLVGPDPREAARPKREVLPPTPPRPDTDYLALERGNEVANRFRIEEMLGFGGFAVAYKVFDSFSDTTRVLKIVVKDRRSTFQRLKQEYRVLERLKPHPNVVKVVWADKLPDETPYMVFEYVPGLSVGDMLDAGALSLEDVRRIADDTLAGLEHLHASGVFHRDIKPSNLLWTDQGVRIIDFNVAVHEGDSEPRPGGTRRYIPPDLELGDALTREEEIDRDLYALGLTLYECATGRYPWTEATPPSKITPRDPQELVPDLSPEFAQVILRAIASRRAERFSSASEFKTALAGLAGVRRPAPLPLDKLLPRTETPPSSSLLQPHKPNFNPFVSHLLTMYSQSPRTNAGTRGLDAVGRETYVNTLLDDKLRPAVLAGEFRLVIVTGNAGDGKTAFIQQLERKALPAGLKQRPNGSEFALNGKRFVTNYDGSQDEETKTNDEVLCEFFRPFEGRDAANRPTDESRIIAINEGRLVDFLTEHDDRFAHLERLVLAGLVGGPPSDGVVTVNLNLRAIVANRPGAAADADSIFDRQLRRLTHDQFWDACGGCDIRDRCYVYHNARTLMDPVAGPKVSERLRSLYAITHLRGRLHVTMRDLRSALAFTLAGTRDCDQIHVLFASPGAEARRQILEGFYFNSWRGGDGSADRLLSLLREVDIGEATNPDIDRALDYLPPSARDMLRFTFAQRGDYDSQLLERMHRELPRDALVGSALRRVGEHRDYVAMLRRRQFFERRDDAGKEMLPYRTADEFWRLVTGESQPSIYLDALLTAVNRGEGLSDPKRLGNALALRVRDVEHGTIRSYRLFSGENFQLVLPPTGDNEFVEHIPQALRLVYSAQSGQEAELLVGLDIYEMLARLNDGYRPSLEELQGYYVSFAVFKNVLSSAPYQEVLLTRTGHDFYRIRRESAGTLYLDSLEGGGALMGIKGRDQEFRLKKLSYIDFKPLNMDRVLTMLFPRLRFGGYGTRRPPRKHELTVADFAREYLNDPKMFVGFGDHQDVVERWIETDLMDMVNRGRPNQALAAPRPLHGNTYKFRNARHARDYGAAEHLYWMLYHARGGRGQVARDALTRFFFPGVDLHTDKYDPSASVDVETQALLHFDQQVTVDTRDSQEPERFPPLCVGQADLLADDTLRLLAYEPYIPRSVLVEYLKTLFAFHLGLYHLRLIKLLPALVRRRGADPICEPKNCPVAPAEVQAHGACPYRVYLLVDLGNDLDGHMADLARQSADLHYRRIPNYVGAHYLVRKLDEFAEYLSRKVGKLSAPARGFFAIGDLLSLLEPPHAGERDSYFKMRLAGLLEDTAGETRDEIDPEVRRVTQISLSDLDMFIEILMALRGPYHRRYITEFLDSVLKLGGAGIMHQSKGSARRFSMGSLLLEVLLQMAVLRSSGAGFHTRELRIDELLTFLQERYGIYVDRLPPGDGFGTASITDLAALRRNGESFKDRLREIGFFRDLSDAYVTQTITPRYAIAASSGSER